MIKCIVFDLDNTIWDGTLDANDNVKINENISSYIKRAYEQGIVLAIASKNNYEQAYKKIVELGIEKFFYEFYISWDDKYKAIKDLAKRLNISEEHVLFVDDSDIELSEALYYIPTLQILNVKDVKLLSNYLNDAEPMTDEAKNRNKIYKILEQRKEKQEKMSKEDFLKYCNIVIDIYQAKEDEFYRINELLSRTNQMNLNNKILTVSELKKISQEKGYTIFSVKMKDIFADYGIVGTTIIEETENVIEIKYFAISCKVEGRNIGKNVLKYVKEIAKEKNKDVVAKYIYNLKNEKLKALFILNGFILNSDNYYTCKINENRKDDSNKPKVDKKITEKVTKIVGDITKKKLEENYSIKDELDSLMFIRLIVTIEKEFNIEIDLTKMDIDNFDTIEKICKYVENKKMKINHIGTKNIRTERLLLRKFNENDAKGIFETWTNDSEVAKYMVWDSHENINETEEWLRKCLSKYDKLDIYNWGIELKSNRKLIGSISANKLENDNDCYEIGYAIGKEHWTKGYATEALNGVINFLKEEVGIKNFFCRHAKENKASGSVIKKVGFKYKGKGNFATLDGKKIFESEEYYLEM